MFGRKRKAADKPAKKAKTVKKEVKVEPKVEAPKVEEPQPAVQGLSGRELNRALRGKTVQRRHARGRV